MNNYVTIIEKEDSIITSSNLTELGKKLFYVKNMHKNKRVYCYTSFENFLKIIYNRTLNLTKLGNSNDQGEIKLYHKDYVNYYSMSFFSSPEEYMSMWAMYGNTDGIKIRLSLLVNELIDLTKDRKSYEICYMDNDVQRSAKKNGLSNSKLILSDVIYYDELENKLRYDFKNINIINDKKQINSNKLQRKDLIGKIKYRAWEYEKEIRLLLRCNNEFSNKHNKLLLKLNEETLKRMKIKITFNPYISKELKTFLKDSFNNNNEIRKYNIEFTDSHYDGQVKNNFWSR